MSLTETELIRKIAAKYKVEISHTLNTSFYLKVFYEDIHCGDINVKVLIKDYEVIFEVDKQYITTPKNIFLIIIQKY